MTTAFYRNGTVAVTQGSKVVTGTGTNWATGATKPLAGDVFIFKNKIYEVEHVISNTEIRLFRNLEDATATAQAYVIMRNASLNISSRIAAQVAQVVNQKQIMLDEFHKFLTNDTDPTVNLTDTLGNPIPVTPIPMLDASHNQAIKDLNDKADQVISSNILMDESEARAIQMLHLEHFDASGMVNTGKHKSSGTAINEGMYLEPTIPNTIGMGRLRSGDKTGTSKTDFAVTHIAGAISNLLGVSEYSADNGLYFKLPEAEDGTRIYDSTGDARGSGKASLDLKVDVDPKYGDVPTGIEAQILREAVGRAFEGVLINGDFRLGNNDPVNGWRPAKNGAIVWNSDSTITLSSDNAGDVAKSLQYFSGRIPDGAEIEVTVSVGATTNTTDREGRIYITGLGNRSLPENETTTFTFTSSDGTKYVELQSDNQPDATVVINSVSVRVVTEEVVTHPVDLVGLEYYEEELTGRQEIFECIQSTSTTFGTTGVPTVLSTRKLSYFQQYDGQFPEVTANPDFINDRYRCVVWDELSEPDKRKIAAYMKERLFMGVNKKPVNGRLRARTIRGAGNGDWDNIDSNSTYLTQGATQVRPKGALDDNPDITQGAALYLGRAATINGSDPSLKGVFNVRRIVWEGVSYPDGVAYQGRCFMYVVATVPRANKGAYDEKENPWGTRAFVKSGQGWDNYWYETGREWTMAELFILAESADVDSTWRVGSASGDIDSGISGHPDGIFYDGITAGGLNGVIDWRLPAVANDSPEEAAKVEAKVENKTYRGLEKLVRTRYVSANLQSVRTGSASGFVYVWDSSVDKVPSWFKSNLLIGGWLYTLDGESGNVIRKDKITKLYQSGVSANAWAVTIQDKVYANSTNISDGVYYHVALEEEVNLSVSGEFNTKMVIADPVNFLKVFPNGIEGTWCPVIPDGSGAAGDFPISRKGLKLTSDNRTSAISTVNDGASWQSTQLQTDRAINEFKALQQPNRVIVVNYKAFAKQTKRSTNKPVYNAKAGVMQVFASQWSGSAVLSETLLGIITKASTSVIHYENLPLIKSAIDVAEGSGLNKMPANDRYYPKHMPLSIGPPTNDSKAFKVLPYQISNNGQASIGYQANELTWKNLPPTAINIDGTTGVSIESGKLYRLTAGKHIGLVIHCSVSASNVIMDNQLLGRDGKFYSISSGGEVTKFEVWDGSCWGDDGKIKITADGSDTFVDLNGNTNLSVVHELAIPYGWTSNHARAGKQVPGVDL